MGTPKEEGSNKQLELALQHRTPGAKHRALGRKTKATVLQGGFTRASHGVRYPTDKMQWKLRMRRRSCACGVANRDHGPREDSEEEQDVVSTDLKQLTAAHRRVADKMWKRGPNAKKKLGGQQHAVSADRNPKTGSLRP
jgi:hypothetical protein